MTGGGSGSRALDGSGRFLTPPGQRGHDPEARGRLSRHGQGAGNLGFLTGNRRGQEYRSAPKRFRPAIKRSAIASNQRDPFSAAGGGLRPDTRSGACPRLGPRGKYQLKPVFSGKKPCMFGGFYRGFHPGHRGRGGDSFIVSGLARRERITPPQTPPPSKAKGALSGEIFWGGRKTREDKIGADIIRLGQGLVPASPRGPFEEPENERSGGD